MHLEDLEINKFVLLTGAGFTHDFGGFLANEMWAVIFNNPEVGKYPRLKELLQSDFDYESIYYKVVDGHDFDDEAKNALTDVIFSAYKKMDDKIRSYYSLGNSQPVNIPGVVKFIDRFSGLAQNTGKNNTKGFFFTLNQDLLVERYFRDSGLTTLYVNQPTVAIHQDKVFDEKTCSVVLSPSELDKTNPLSSSKFFYVKLHGSMNWYSSNGKRRLVIGRNKSQQISDEPVLKRYFELFERALSTQNLRLFVIGYGFGDEHINQVIADSIKNNHLRLYVLNPSNPESFKKDLHDRKPQGERIWNGLTGYYPYNLSQVFPDGDTIEYKLIRDNYFAS